MTILPCQNAHSPSPALHDDRYALPLNKPFALMILLLLATLPYLPWLRSFFYYDDGWLLDLGQRVTRGEWQLITDFSFHGHFRPLPVMTVTEIFARFGARNSLPYHLAAIFLHVINVLLAYRFVSTLLGPSSPIPFLAAAIFAVHWAGSEAVTYLSGVGMLWSCLGSLVAAEATFRWIINRRLLALAAIPVAMALALAGGEYGIAVLPLILIAAWWALHTTPTKSRRLPLATLALATLPLLLGYIGFEIAHQPAWRPSSDYVVGTHMFITLNRGLASLAFPTAWINPSAFFILFCLTLLFLIIRRVKPKSLFEPAALLLAALLCILPFTPSQLGYYPRFSYIASLLWAAGILLLLKNCLSAHPSLRRLPSTFGLLLIAINLLHMEIRMQHLSPRLDEVRSTVETAEQFLRTHSSNARLAFDTPDIYGVSALIAARNSLTPIQLQQLMSEPTSPGDARLHIRSSWNKPYCTPTQSPPTPPLTP